jgi:O-antigen/teichoic acid export membrane protein
LYFFFRLMTQTKNAGQEEYQLREWISFALPNFLTSILDTVLEAVDTILLAFLVVSIVAVGQYAAAIRYSAFIAMPLQSLNVVFAPTIAELHHKGEKEKLAVMFKVVTNWTIIFSLPICLVTILFSRPLLGISGDSFLAAWPLLLMLSVGNMVNAGTGSVGYILLMTGHQKLSFINSLTAVIVNIVLGIILTRLYGAIGTAIATGLALAVVNLMRLLQVRLLLKIHPYRWDTLKPLGAGLISSLLTGALLYFLELTHVSFRFYHFNLSLELFLIPVFLVVYIALLMAFKFSPEDTIVIDKLRKKFRGRKK